MDIAEMLVVDHLSIRLWVKCNPFKVGVDEFSSFHEFIVNCHAKIEDEILFPTLKNFIWIHL